jgi:hypothetical protein
MRIHIDNHGLVDDLCAHYARSGFKAASVGDGMIQVARPDAQTKDQERREVLMHLRIWRAISPGVNITLVS